MAQKQSFVDVAQFLSEGVLPGQLLEKLEHLTTDPSCREDIAQYAPLIIALRTITQARPDLIRYVAEPTDRRTAFLLGRKDELQEYIQGIQSREELASWIVLDALLEDFLFDKWTAEDDEILQSRILDSEVDELRCLGLVLLSDFGAIVKFTPTFQHYVVTTIIFSKGTSNSRIVEEAQLQWPGELSLIDHLVSDCLKRDWQSFVEKLVDADDWVSVHILLVLEACGLLRGVRGGFGLMEQVADKYAVQLCRQGHFRQSLVYVTKISEYSDELISAFSEDERALDPEMPVPDGLRATIVERRVINMVQKSSLEDGLDLAVRYNVGDDIVAERLLQAIRRVAIESPEETYPIADEMKLLERYDERNLKCLPKLDLLHRFHLTVIASSDQGRALAVMKSLYGVFKDMAECEIWDLLIPTAIAMRRAMHADVERALAALKFLPAVPTPAIIQALANRSGQNLQGVVSSAVYVKMQRKYQDMVADCYEMATLILNQSPIQEPTSTFNRLVAWITSK